MRHTKFWLSGLVVLLAVVGLFSGGVLAADAGSVTTQSTGTVYVSVEEFTLGKGYLYAPQEVSITSGETAKDVLIQVLGSGNYKSNEQSAYGWYLSAIKDGSITAGEGNDISGIPSYITSQDGIDLTSKANTTGYLSEKDFTGTSGWTYKVNGVWASVGFGGTTLKDGDVMRVGFTVYGYGNDWAKTGSAMGDGWPTYANLDTITMNLAKAKTAGLESSSEYSDAVAAASDLTSSQATVDRANKVLAAKLKS